MMKRLGALTVPIVCKSSKLKARRFWSGNPPALFSNLIRLEQVLKFGKSDVLDGD